MPLFKNHIKYLFMLDIYQTTTTTLKLSKVCIVGTRHCKYIHIIPKNTKTPTKIFADHTKFVPIQSNPEPQTLYATTALLRQLTLSH